MKEVKKYFDVGIDGSKSKVQETVKSLSSLSIRIDTENFLPNKEGNEPEPWHWHNANGVTIA